MFLSASIERGRPDLHTRQFIVISERDINFIPEMNIRVSDRNPDPVLFRFCIPIRTGYAFLTLTIEYSENFFLISFQYLDFFFFN